jgi:hypothetical protein
LKNGSIVSSLDGDAPTDDAERRRQLQIELEDISIPMNVLRDKKQLIIWFQQALQDGAFDENNSQVFAYPTDAFDDGEPSESSGQPVEVISCTGHAPLASASAEDATPAPTPPAGATTVGHRQRLKRFTFHEPNSYMSCFIWGQVSSRQSNPVF